ncbi:MAG: glycosyltransferase family 2 protein, partial [Muribaculaceae bacterium]
MISVIVPVYNVEKYLRRCVDSLLAQTYTDFEIILVDDGSTDSSAQICDHYTALDPRIRVIHKANGGLSSARNAGIDVSIGDYICFIDSDDYINDNMLGSMIKCITDNHAEICMCGYSIVEEHNHTVHSITFSESRSYSTDEIFREVIIPLKTAAWNKLFSRALIGENRFPDGRIHGEDLVFFLNVLQDSTRVCSTEYIGYNYIKRPSSITTSAFNAGSFDEVWCKDEALKLVKEKYPQYSDIALRWSFRARLNLLRKIHNLSEYATTANDYKVWLSENYLKSKRCLTFKDKMEYTAIRTSKLLYSFFI